MTVITNCNYRSNPTHDTTHCYESPTLGVCKRQGCHTDTFQANRPFKTFDATSQVVQYS